MDSCQCACKNGYSGEFCDNGELDLDYNSQQNTIVITNGKTKEITFKCLDQILTNMKFRKMLFQIRQNIKITKNQSESCNMEWEY